MITNKPKILIFADYYLPGYKSGGGMRTIVNMVDRLYGKYDFWIVTRDHDGKLDTMPYTNVKINDWNDVRNAKVYYLDKDSVKISKLRELILEVKPNSIYTNSYFATLAIYVLKLRRLKQIPKLNLIIAPCGELSEGALKFRKLKKTIFMNYAKIIGLYDDVIWKASNDLEKTEIERVKGKRGQIIVAPDMPPNEIFPDYQQCKKINKISGEANLVFISRLNPKKNLKWLFDNLQGIDGNLLIDIIGPIDDEKYWQECLDSIAKLPKNIIVTVKDSIPHEQVSDTLLNYHFFILPTLGENFGHIFLEAFASGCPLIISDRTPWLNLETQGIGFDIPLENSKLWIDKLNYCISLDNNTYTQLSTNARNYVKNWLKDTKLEKNTIQVLEASLSKHS